MATPTTTSYGGKSYSTSHSGKWWLCLLVVFPIVIVALLMSLSGDVETNPGPLCDTCEHIHNSESTSFYFHVWQSQVENEHYSTVSGLIRLVIISRMLY